MEGAYATSTLRGYRASMLNFEAWCTSHRRRAFPAAPKTLSAYLDELGRRLRATTIKGAAYAIGTFHRLAGYPDPNDHPDVHLALRRASRSRPHRPRQALGISGATLDRLTACCANDYRGRRDLALMRVGFEGLCRGSEIAALRLSDFAMRQDGRATILLRQGKTDQSGLGRLIVLSRGTASALKEWIRSRGVMPGPLFPRDGNEVGSLPAPMTTTAITFLLRLRASAAGIDEAQIKEITSHSLRIGGAQQLTINGCNLSQIMRAGGWKTVETVSRYIEAAQPALWEGNDKSDLPLPNLGFRWHRGSR